MSATEGKALTPTWVHHGHVIHFMAGTGMFSAVVEGRTRNARSLEGIKKVIDRSRVCPFKPFYAIHLGPFFTKSRRRVKIVGLVTKSRRWGGVSQFFVTDSRQEIHPERLVSITPKNLRALERYLRIDKYIDRQIEKLQRRRRAARAKVQHLKVSDYLKTPEQVNKAVLR